MQCDFHIYLMIGASSRDLMQFHDAVATAHGYWRGIDRRLRFHSDRCMFYYQLFRCDLVHCTISHSALSIDRALFDRNNSTVQTNNANILVTRFNVHVAQTTLGRRLISEYFLNQLDSHCTTRYRKEARVRRHN